MGIFKNGFFYIENLKIKKKGKKNEWKKYDKRRIASIFFTLDVNARNSAWKGYSSKIKGDLLNYRLGYLHNSIQFIDCKIKNEERLSIKSKFKNKEQLKNLKEQPLYMSESFLYSYNPWKYKEKKKQITMDKLFKSYEFDYKVVEDGFLNHKIINAKEDFYYLLYTQMNAAKILTVINGKTGEIIYQDRNGLSYNIKPKDLRHLSNSIKKL